MVQGAAVAVSGSVAGALQWPGHSSHIIAPRSVTGALHRGQEAAVASSGSVAEARKRQERCRSVAWPQTQQLQRGPVRSSIRGLPRIGYIRLRRQGTYGMLHNGCHHAWVALLNIFTHCRAPWQEQFSLIVQSYIYFVLPCQSIGPHEHLLRVSFIARPSPWHARPCRCQSFFLIRKRCRSVAWPQEQQLQCPGALQERSSNLERAVAASESVAEARRRCSVRERCRSQARSVAEAKSSGGKEATKNLPNPAQSRNIVIYIYIYK